MACRKLVKIEGFLGCKEDSERPVPIICKYCENYEESNGEVEIILVYHHLGNPLNNYCREIKIEMPNVWAARKCICRNIQNYLKPRLFEGNESFWVGYLSDIRIVSRTDDGDVLPCRTNVLSDGMVSFCNEDGEL